MDELELQYATIFKKILYEDGNIGYKPEKILEGYFADEDMLFIDKDGTPYYHIIDEVETCGYCDRINVEEAKELYPDLNDEELKKRLFDRANEDAYIYYDENSNALNAPIILYKKIDDENSTTKMLLDQDVIDYYSLYYLDFYNKIKKAVENGKNFNITTTINSKGNQKSTKELSVCDEKQEELDIKINVNELFNEITSQVIDQDEPIKKILTAIWKQYNNFSDNKSRNILINGSTGVGKTETFRILTKLLDVPCVIASATEYTASGYVGKNVEDMLIDLIRQADFDVKKAERGILIIDEIDKISESNSGHSQVNQRDVQEALLKILEDGIFNLNIDYADYTFDTSKLMVIGMGSWSRIDLTPKITVGFEKKEAKKTYKDLTREDIVANGLIPELVGRFPVIVQMNELNYDSFIRILKSKHNALMKNKEFLIKQGVDLKVNDSAYSAIADKASKDVYGARGLDEIVERALSDASFEIATNPEIYSELIIDDKTIEDNKKYTLVKRIK